LRAGGAPRVARDKSSPLVQLLIRKRNESTRTVPRAAPVAALAADTTPKRGGACTYSATAPPARRGTESAASSTAYWMGLTEVAGSAGANAIFESIHGAEDGIAAAGDHDHPTETSPIARTSYAAPGSSAPGGSESRNDPATVKVRVSFTRGASAAAVPTPRNVHVTERAVSSNAAGARNVGADADCAATPPKMPPVVASIGTPPTVVGVLGRAREAMPSAAHVLGSSTADASAIGTPIPPTATPHGSSRV
jgi:hypothetical protein